MKRQAADLQAAEQHATQLSLILTMEVMLQARLLQETARLQSRQHLQRMVSHLTVGTQTRNSQLHTILIQRLQRALRSMQSGTKSRPKTTTSPEHPVIIVRHSNSATLILHSGITLIQTM